MEGNLKLALITGSIGIFGSVGIAIITTLYHKIKKAYSFKLIEIDDCIVITHNRTFTILKTISIFLACTMFTAFIAELDSTRYIPHVLIIIYSLSLFFAGFLYSRRNAFKVIINKDSLTIFIHKRKYSLKEYSVFAISNKNFFDDDPGSVGLYIKNEKNKYVLVYGLSIRSDIEELKNLIQKSFTGQPGFRDHPANISK
jgi:hypothetical protein